MSRPVILDRREAEALLDIFDLNPDGVKLLELDNLKTRCEDYLKHLSKRSEL